MDPRLQEDELHAYQPDSWNINDYGYGYANMSETNNLYQPITAPYSASFGICGGCNTDVGHGRYLSCMNAVWHPQCFTCRGCTHPISDFEFSVYEGCPYHKSCYEESHYPRCDVCRQIIPTNANGLVEFRTHPFWSQKYCARHDHDGTPRCCSCDRMETWNTRYIDLKDKRKLCSECLNSAIMDTEDCQPLFRDIQKFFKGLNMKISQQIPLLLVEKATLIEAIGGETSMQGHHRDIPDTRGICLVEERRIADSAPRRPRIGFRNLFKGTKAQPHRLRHHSEVNSILILYSLPRLLTGIILAHELMHAWLRLDGFNNLSQEIEEGICQVVACMWLESQMESMSDPDKVETTSGSPFEVKLGKFLKQQIATDSSDVYGNGFRAGHRAVSRFGLRATVDHMRRTGGFPC